MRAAPATAASDRRTCARDPAPRSRRIRRARIGSSAGGRATCPRRTGLFARSQARRASRLRPRAETARMLLGSAPACTDAARCLKPPTEVLQQRESQVHFGRSHQAQTACPARAREERFPYTRATTEPCATVFRFCTSAYLP